MHCSKRPYGRGPGSNVQRGSPVSSLWAAGFSQIQYRAVQENPGLPASCARWHARHAGRYPSWPSGGCLLNKKRPCVFGLDLNRGHVSVIPLPVLSERVFALPKLPFRGFYPFPSLLALFISELFL